MPMASRDGIAGSDSLSLVFTIEVSAELTLSVNFEVKR